MIKIGFTYFSVVREYAVESLWNDTFCVALLFLHCTYLILTTNP